MSNELNTLLVALYVFVDDPVVPPRTGRGRRPLLSDSELITLAVAQVLLCVDRKLAGVPGLKCTVRQLRDP